MEPIQIGPIPVRSVAEEYQWLDRYFGPNGYQRQMQSLISGRDRMFDRLDITVRGVPYTAWFDISQFMPFIRPAGQVAPPSSSSVPRWLIPTGIILAVTGLAVAFDRRSA